MYYTIYKITNIVNNKYYIGKHQTINLDDGYMGSGKLIKKAIDKYGIGNFTKEILFVFDNEQEMNDKEKELVVVSEETYNLCPGGHGGFGYINTLELDRFSRGKKSGLIHKSRMETDISYREKRTKQFLKIRRYNPPKTVFKHTTESLTKMKSTFKNIGHAKGHKNSQFGTKWVNNGKTIKKIKINELDMYLNNGYILGRKIIS